MIFNRPPCAGSGPPATSEHFQPVASHIRSRMGWAKRTNPWMHLCAQLDKTHKGKINRNPLLAVLWRCRRVAFCIILPLRHCRFIFLRCLLCPLHLLLLWELLIHISSHLVPYRSMFGVGDTVAVRKFLRFDIDLFALCLSPDVYGGLSSRFLDGGTR